MKFIELLLNEIDDLEPFPQIAHKVLELSEDPESNMSEIADVVQYDPIITADIIKMSNSAYFGLSRNIDSVKDALSVLGLDKVVDLVLMKCSSKNFKGIQPGYDLQEGALWKKSACAAVIAKKIALKKEIKTSSRVFTSTLLRDIGKVILGRYVESKKDNIFCLIEEDGLSFDEAEKKVFGIDQSELSALIIKKWGLPGEMVIIVKNSFMPKKGAKFSIESDIVYFAHNICLMLGIGVGADGLAYRFDEDVMERLDIDHFELEQMMVDFAYSISELESLIESV